MSFSLAIRESPNTIIDLLIALGHDFVPAVELLEQWLRAYQGHRTGSTS